MLTYDDEPTIRHAIWKRLKKERGVDIVDIQIKEVKKGDVVVREGQRSFAPDDHIAVGVWLIVTDRTSEEGIPDVRGFFDLPVSFELRQVHNEIDEIAEAVKKARKLAGVSKLIWTPQRDRHRAPIVGTGLRGRWAGV